jgi:hypothetical protein
MKNKIKNYLAIFQLEIEDLEEDIQYLIQKGDDRKKNGSLTNYVFLENQAILKNEIHALEYLKKLVRNTDYDNFRSIEGLIQYLREEFRKVVDNHGYAEAILIFIDRKMEKVKNYVDS